MKLNKNLFKKLKTNLKLKNFNTIIDNNSLLIKNKIHSAKNIFKLPPIITNHKTNSSNALINHINEDIEKVKSLDYSKINFFSIKSKIDNNFNLKNLRKGIIKNYDEKKNIDLINETELENEIKTNENEFNKLKEQNKKLYENLKNLNNELTDILLELDFIENNNIINNNNIIDNLNKNDNYIFGNIILNNINQHKNNNHNKNVNELKLKALIYSQQKSFHDLLVNNMNNLSEKKENIKNDIKKIKNDIINNKNLINNLKLNIKKNKEILYKYYLKILYEGKDFRLNEGLTWIIRKIWKLNKEIPLNFFPNYFDYDCVNFIIKYSKLLDKYEEKKKSHENENKKKFINKKKNIFQTQSNLIMLMDNNNKININIIKNNNSNNYDNNNENDAEIDKKVEKLEEEIKLIENEIESLKNNELKRINKEFLYNEYERRFNIKYNYLISSLFGLNNNEEILSLNKEKNNLFENLKKIKFCSSFKNEKTKKNFFGLNKLKKNNLNVNEIYKAKII